MGGLSIWQLLIVAVIVLVIFGTKRLRNLGGDLGTSVKGFKDAMKEGEENAQKKFTSEDSDVIEGETVKKTEQS